MWKKQEDNVGAQPDLARQAPESGDAPSESSIDSRLEQWDFAARSRQELVEDDPQPSSSPNMTTYTEALNEFTRSATAFIEHLPLLTRAREAYEQAMKASAELRRVLDTGEENLQTLMTQLEQAVNVHGVKTASDRKRPELAKVEAIRSTEESPVAVKRYP